MQETVTQEGLQVQEAGLAASSRCPGQPQPLLPRFPSADTLVSGEWWRHGEPRAEVAGGWMSRSATVDSLRGYATMGRWPVAATPGPGPRGGEGGWAAGSSSRGRCSPNVHCGEESSSELPNSPPSPNWTTRRPLAMETSFPE